MNCSILNSSIGRICILGDTKIHKIIISDDFKENPSKLTNTAKAQLQEYFLKKRKTFSFPIQLHGTTFENKIYAALAKIPFSKTTSYGELSNLIFNSKKYARPIGNALNKNQLLIVIPCHRVKSNSGIGGFNQGINIKEFLLNHESVNI
ncbi:MAG: methylated-DNA--[protein]-cysteine S-methyltransferase [Candidatus Woesearchaeota archaeon]